MSLLRQSPSRQPRVRRLRPLVAVGAALTLAFAAAACGSSKSVLASADFVKQANAICADIRAQMDAVTRPTDLASAATQFAKLDSISQSGTDDLAALSLAGDSKDARDAMVAALDKANIQLKAASKAALGGNEAAVNEASDVYNTNLTEMRAVAEKAGLEDCSAGDETSPTDPPTSGTGTASDVPKYVDASTLLNPWPGQTFAALSETEANDLASSSATGPDSPVQVIVVAGLNVRDDLTGAQSFVSVFELDRKLSADESSQFVSGVVGDAEDATSLTIGGVAGVAYTGPAGVLTFVRLLGSTAVIIFGEDEVTLNATVEGLFAANPDL